MEKHRSQEGTKKGPWNAEEDEILIKFVKENGPKDWSSIRTKGLLPRTGKSCRLRWVNKLRPNLKKGCKFSEEEERMVLDLQATFGNKWATIATYLQGRTDNDVKNFWSTRQKRLNRMSRSSNRSSNNKHNKCRIIPSSNEASSSSRAPKSSSNKMIIQESSPKYELWSCFCPENSNTTKDMMMPQPASCWNPFMHQPISALPPLQVVDMPVTLPPLEIKPPIATLGELSLSQVDGIGHSEDFLGFELAPNYMEVLANCDEQDAAFQENHDQDMITDFGVSMEKIDFSLFGDLPVDWFDLPPESVPKSSDK